MEMKRGDLVTIALTGDFGKPRPALIIRSDLFAEHPLVTVLPITSDLEKMPLLRIPIDPAPTNGDVIRRLVKAHLKTPRLPKAALPRQSNRMERTRRPH
jgi:mRNA-degrading endonuclease toxin of MazEF toxin-antitoxin module